VVKNDVLDKGFWEVKKITNKPSCFKCDASVTSFTFIDYPLGDKLLTIVYCGKCGAVQGIVTKEK